MQVAAVGMRCRISHMFRRKRCRVVKELHCLRRTRVRDSCSFTADDSPADF